MQHPHQHPDRSQIPDAGPAAPTAAAGLPLVIGHADMNDAFTAGTAVPFAPAISWLARYADRWWIVYERGWLCITDQLAAADIDQRAALINASTGNGHSPKAEPADPAQQAQEEPCPQPRS